jgi:hypothetical protein
MEANMSISPDPKERELHARYRRVKKAFQEGEYTQALNLLAGLPQDYLEANPEIKSDVKSIQSNAKIGQALSGVGVFNALHRQLRVNWTLFAIGLMAIAGLIIIGLILGISAMSGSDQSTATATIVVFTESPTPSDVSTPTLTGKKVTEEGTEPPTGPPTQKATKEPWTEEPPPQETEGSVVPTNVRVVDSTDTNITLTWSNPGGQTKVMVKRNDGPIAVLPADSQRYTDSGLSCGSTHHYTIVTVNEAGQSESAPITAQTEACPPPPAPHPTLTGKIAVPVFDTNAGTYGVYIARAEERWQPKLFFQNGSQPAFSPDGRQIILRSWRKAEEGFGQRLVLFSSLRADAGDERLMTYNLEDAHPSLRADGEIVFHTRREGGPILVTLGTWPGAESDIANQHKLGLGENPDWLGNRIVYYAPGPPSGLYVMNADGSNIQLALSEPGSLAPAAAPDGDHVAVSLQRAGRWHVFTLSVSQGQTSLVQLTNENADDQLPVWSPDGKSIAFVSNRGGKWAVWVMPAPGAQAPWPAGASQDGQVNSNGSDQRKLFDLDGPIDGQVSIAPNMSYGWGEERLSWAP